MVGHRVSVLVPDGWQSEDSDGLFSARSGNDEISMFVWTERADSVQSFLDGVYRALAEIVKGFDIFTRGEVLATATAKSPRRPTSITSGDWEFTAKP